MHTILGAGGPISRALTIELSKTNNKIRLASRREIKTQNHKISWMKADLLNQAEVQRAVKGSEVVYLCAGLKYDATVWQQQWPLIMQNVINAVKEVGARLIFFDNVYSYGLVEGPMTEDTPYNPSSAKGQVRAQIATTLMEEVKAGNIRASIARAPDFYGATESGNSFFDQMVLEKYSKKQKAMWLGNPESLHTFIYVPDAAKAVSLLGLNPESDNQTWHLPSAKAIKGTQFMEIAAHAFGVKPEYMKVNKLMLKLLGLFNQPIKGTIEMYYQYQHDYVFCSKKFEEAFSVQPASYYAGISYLADTFYKR